MSSKDRQRAAARARLQREIAARAAAQARKRRRNTIIAGSTGGAVVVIVLVIVLIASLGGGKKKPAAQASSAPSATTASCTWTSATNPSPAPSAAASAAASGAPSAAPSSKPSPNPYLKDVGKPPTTGLPQTGTQTMTITTNQGPITVSIDDSKTPCAAASFTYLASKKFFDNSSCYSMHNTGYYIIQCGDPSGTGKGGPTYTYTPENLPTDSRPTYTTGMVGVGTPPNAGNNGSQFFIVYKNTEDGPAEGDTPTSMLPGNFTVLGTVTSGMDIVQKVAAAGLTPANPNDPSTGKPKTPLDIKTLVVSPAGSSAASGS